MACDKKGEFLNAMSYAYTCEQCSGVSDRNSTLEDSLEPEAQLFSVPCLSFCTDQIRFLVTITIILLCLARAPAVYTSSVVLHPVFGHSVLPSDLLWASCNDHGNKTKKYYDINY